MMDDKRLVKIFKALGDETRLRIVETLYLQGETTCAAFDEKFNLSKPALSHHYKVLLEADLIIARKEKQCFHLRLNEETFRSYLPGFLNKLEFI
jgi:DNA-binding transcriptional ArsR family regulator